MGRGFMTSMLRTAVAIAVGVAAPAARADPVVSLALEPAPAGDHGFVVERAAIHGENLLSVRFIADAARRPLAVINRGGEKDPVLDSQIWLHALATYAIAERFALHLDLPFVVGQAEGDHPRTGQAAPGPDAPTAIGDLRLGARVSLLDPAKRARRRYDLAVGANAWLPTGGDAYASDGAPRGGAALLLDGNVSRFYWAANAGLRGRPPVQLGFVSPIHSGTSIVAGAAGGVYLDQGHALAVGPELSLDTALTGGGPFSPAGTALHLLLGAHYLALDGPFNVGLAAGPDIGKRPGSADYRVLLVCGIVPERALLPPDRDHDGIPDSEDACPTVPGIASDDPTRNGCPPGPLDTDGDGIPDSDDACPLVFGQPSSDANKNGCPEEPDRDGDGVPDDDDACPDVYGQASPNPELNGCPVPDAPPLAELGDREITISQQVQFETASAVLLPASNGILGEVARLVAAHAEIELLEVQGHTDERGTAEYNQRLSQDRAASVVTWLTQHGIAKSRLTARGYGRDRPIADNATDLGMQKNRRVEFHVLRVLVPEAPEEP